MSGSVVTVGSFDGLHLGHQAVLREVMRRARASGRSSVLVSFVPHPLAILNPSAAPALLTPGDERLEVLAESGVDRLCQLRFDRRLADLTPAEFVREVLVGRCGMQELVIGHDHGFGRGRSGDVATLRELGVALGFAVEVVDAVEVEGVEVSSSRVRRAVAAGDLPLARRLLGRSYGVTGRVGKGAQRGRTIGVPTINLKQVPREKLLPPDGVYAVRAEWNGGSAGGMMNQGPKPTFDDGHRALEAHLFGFSGDLYDQRVRIEWVRRIRDTRRFASGDELKDQLERDAVEARAILAAAPA